MDRYIVVQWLKPKKGDPTGTTQPHLSYLDLFAPVGESLRTALEPIADEL